MDFIPSIDLNIPEKLRDAEYRRQFFLAETSANIAKQLIGLRKLRDLSQATLAEKIGTKQSGISRVESADYSNWSFNTLRKIAEILDARLRIVIEPAEDVLHEYEEYPQRDTGARSSILDHLAESPLNQRNRSSVLDALPARKDRYGITQRGEQQARRIDDGDTVKGGSAISA